MIELLLQAERALTTGMIDQAERLYWQAVEADPHNAIAVTGLARVALEHADDRTAYVFARKALAIDPDNPAAQRLVARLEEVMTYRGESVPVVNPADPMPGAPGPSAAAAPAVGNPAIEQPSAERAHEGEPSEIQRRGVIGRLFHRGH